MKATFAMCLCVALPLLGSTACMTTTVRTVRAKAAGDCEDARTCEASGQLEMSNDGHGYIGVLRLDDGSCINVSLPEGRSKQLMGQAPQAANLTGRVLFFPYEEGVLSFTVSGRKVGYGTCTAYFLFVK